MTSWNREIGLTWKDAVHRLSGYGVTDANLGELMPVEDASGLSIDEFYQKYKNQKRAIVYQRPFVFGQNK